MIFKRTDIHFRADDAHRFLPWLVGVMACLTALFLCVGLSLEGWIVDRHDRYSGSFTVNIPASTENLSEKLPKIRVALAKVPGVTLITQLSNGQLADMLEPWIGSADAAAALPLPAVIDVGLRDQTPAPDYAALEKSLSAIAPGTEVDAHERWVSAFADFSAAAQSLAGVLAFLLLVAMAAMIAFTSRTSLKLHAKTVLLLHAIGADDDYIAAQFQQEAFRLTLPGAAVGCLAAGLMYGAIGWFVSALPVSLMPGLGFKFSHLLLLVLMPFFCAGAAWAVARWSVLWQLERVL